MDLFDLDTYFGSYVPVQARFHPLLKHAACAYASKQLGRAKGKKAIHGGVCSHQASMEAYDEQSVDWEWEGAFHYDRSIALLMEAIREEPSETLLSSHDGMQWEASGSALNQNLESSSRQVNSQKVRLGSDEVVAATAILCVYEFVSATGAAWSRHLNGTKSLLDTTEGSLMPLETPAFDSILHQRRIPSKARRATFWNFARQDYIAACKLSYPIRILIEITHIL